ncbi:MAG: cbb3-type cytochrome oxidase assembly protein CcoS [Bacteroidota bacterium]
MNVLYVLIVVSLLVALFFLGVFLYAVKKGQYDDDYTPSVRMLFDDELVEEKEEKDKNESNDEKLEHNN